MDKEMLETFEAAKKAADVAAEAGGGSPEVDRCLDALKRLRSLPVTTQDLVETQVMYYYLVSSSYFYASLKDFIYVGSLDYQYGVILFLVEEN